MQMGSEIPDELTGIGEAVRARGRQVEAPWRSSRGGRGLDYAEIERQEAAGAAAIERASHQAGLRGLDVDQPRIGIEGQGIAALVAMRRTTPRWRVRCASPAVVA